MYRRNLYSRSLRRDNDAVHEGFRHCGWTMTWFLPLTTNELARVPCIAGRVAPCLPIDIRNFRGAADSGKANLLLPSRQLLSRLLDKAGIVKHQYECHMIQTQCGHCYEEFDSHAQLTRHVLKIQFMAPDLCQHVWPFCQEVP